jgi:antitoxin StbD
MGLMMDRKHASFSVSMTELKKNPTRVKRVAGFQPIVVLNHNKPAFYLLDPDIYEAMLDRLEDISMAGLISERLAMKPQAVTVDFDDV